MEILTEQDKLKTVQRMTLEKMETPTPTGRWNPVPHHVLDTKLTNAIGARGLTITNTNLTVLDGTMYGEQGEKQTIKDGRMMAIYSLGNGYGREGFTHQIAVRNSVDQRWAITMSAAQTVWMCSNGIMSGTRILGRKNTTMAIHQLDGLIDDALGKVLSEFEMNDIRYDRYPDVSVTNEQFHDMGMRAAKEGAITYNHLSKLAGEWDKPTQSGFKEFDGTLWRAFNCFTQVDKHRPFMTKQERTMKLMPVMDAFAGIEQVAA